MIQNLVLKFRDNCLKNINRATSASERCELRACQLSRARVGDLVTRARFEFRTALRPQSPRELQHYFTAQQHTRLV